jgi:TatD DNase family protein
MPAFVDAHCHIDLYESPQQIVDLAEQQHIYTIAVTNAPSVFLHTVELTRNSKYIRPAIGLHPELVHSHKGEIGMFRQYLEQTRYVGEVGLDYTNPDKDVRQAQREILTKVGEWVNEYGDKILTLHSRKAASDVISILSGVKAKMVLHWFSGSAKEFDRAVANGFFFSVNSAMLKSTAARSVILQMPKDRVITETDGPFVMDGNSRADPASVKSTVNALADLWESQPDAVRAAILNNFKEIVAHVDI